MNWVLSQKVRVEYAGMDYSRVSLHDLRLLVAPNAGSNFFIEDLNKYRISLKLLVFI